MAMVNPSLACCARSLPTSALKNRLRTTPLHPCLPAGFQVSSWAEPCRGWQGNLPPRWRNGWMDGSIYSVVSALCRVRRGASITVARAPPPLSRLARRPCRSPPPSHHARCLRPRHHGCRGNSKEHKPVQWGRCPSLPAAPSLRPSPAPDRRPPWTLERVEGWRPRPEIVTE